MYRSSKCVLWARFYSFMYVNVKCIERARKKLIFFSSIFTKHIFCFLFIELSVTNKTDIVDRLYVWECEPQTCEQHNFYYNNRCLLTHNNNQKKLYEESAQSTHHTKKHIEQLRCFCIFLYFTSIVVCIYICNTQ